MMANADRKWVETHILHDGDIQFYGNLLREIEGIGADAFWKEFRRIAQEYLTAGHQGTQMFHALVDATIERLVERDRRYGYPPPFCHKGCDNCCHELVYCTSAEAKGIQEFCQLKSIPIDHEKLQRQLDSVVFDSAGNHSGATTWNDQPRGDQSCIFLDPQEKCCQIWPVRPLVCRVHLAEGSDEFCTPHNGQENAQAKGINYVELSYILSVVFTLHQDSIRKTMGRLLLNENRS
jgi:Fe-S-cluster containining protein